MAEKQIKPYEYVNWKKLQNHLNNNNQLISTTLKEKKH